MTQKNPTKKLLAFSFNRPIARGFMFCAVTQIGLCCLVCFDAEYIMSQEQQTSLETGYSEK